MIIHQTSMAIPVPPDLLSILADLPTSLLVGGCVRDTLLGLPIRDFDVEVYGMDYAECREILTRHGRVDETGKKFSVFKVTTSTGSTHDVSLATRENKTGPRHTDFERVADKNLGPKDGAMRRDFTINAMAWNPRTGELLDFYGGQADLRSRTLRATSDKFADDPLRVLRGMQFAGRFELIADPSLCYTTWEIRDEFQHLSKERVREEWVKWATQSVVPSMGLEFLASCGWLTLFPELEALVRCEQDPVWHPEGWSLKIALKSDSAGPTETVPTDNGRRVASLRQLLSGPTAFDAAVEDVRRAGGAKTVKSGHGATADLIAAEAAGIGDLGPLSPGHAPAVGADSSSLVWTLGTPAVSTDEVVRVVLQIPKARMEAVVFRSQSDLEIVRAIVGPVSVYVMSVLAGQESAAELEFQNDLMNPSGACPFGIAPSGAGVSLVVAETRASSVNDDVFFLFDLALDGNRIGRHTDKYIRQTVKVSIGDVWTHTLHCCDAMAASPGWFKRPATERLELMLGILCHDLGKPSTTGTKTDDEGRVRITAYGHDIAGIEPTESLLTNLGFGQERGFIGRITPLVEFHMAHIRQNFGTPTGVRRLAFDLMPQTLMNLGMVQYSDHSGRPPLPGGLPEKMATVLVLAHELGCAHGKQVPLLSGRDVLGLIPGLKPGPVVGVLLDAMYQAQLDGEFFSVEEAGQWLRRNRGHLLENGGLAPKRIMDGAELIRLGLTPGPRFGEAHRALFDLQLDGKIHSWEDAAQWLVDHFYIAEDHLHCGRSACRQPLSRHWNRVTRKFYCTPCARLLNDNPTHDGIPLCDWPDPDAA